MFEMASTQKLAILTSLIQGLHINYAARGLSNYNSGHFFNPVMSTTSSGNVNNHLITQRSGGFRALFKGQIF